MSDQSRVSSQSVLDQAPWEDALRGFLVKRETEDRLLAHDAVVHRVSRKRRTRPLRVPTH